MIPRNTSASRTTSGSNRPPNFGVSGSNSSDKNGHHDGTITRSTKAPASSFPSTHGLEEPASRATSVAADEPIVRTTITSAFRPVPNGPAKQTSQSTGQASDDRGIITRSTMPAELLFRSYAGGMNGNAAPSSNTIPHTATTQSYGASHLTVPQSSVVSECPHAALSGLHAPSYPIPTLDVARAGVVDEDIEMSCSDLDPSAEMFRENTGGSFYGMQNQNVRSGR